MSTTKRWTVEIFLDEVDTGGTHAAARLDTSEDAHVHGHGTWPSMGDTDTSETGAEAAAGQALSQIAAKLATRAAAGN
jgi:hypothetical protein